MQETVNFAVSPIFEQRKKFKEIYLREIAKFPQEPRKMDFRGQAAVDLIYEYLSAAKPCAIARFGGVEMQAVLEYLCSKGEDIYTCKFSMSNNAGFFSPSKENLDKFAELILRCAPQIDVLGSWQSGETYLRDYLKNAKFISLGYISAFFENSWTRVLEGKNVLVVHPFEKSIKSQYAKRELLFEYERVLPKFNLKTIKAVQSLAGEKVPFKDWFAALDFMKEQISKTDFDIALIGCGAYGFPLAAFVKGLGKKAVHIGGATQLLFRIKGGRWDSGKYREYLPNENWAYPLPEETPKNAKLVEEACYWG